MTFLVALALMSSMQASASPWRKVDTVKGFEGMRAELQHLVDSDPDVKTRTNHLCVVVQTSFNPDVGPVAWVHFREAKWLYAFNDSKHPPISDGNIWGGASVDLAHDVVATQRQVGSSAKLQTRAHVNLIINACSKYGESFVIEKHRG